jgi:hypothetical protein
VGGGDGILKELPLQHLQGGGKNTGGSSGTTATTIDPTVPSLLSTAFYSFNCPSELTKSRLEETYANSPSTTSVGINNTKCAADRFWFF